MYKIPKNFNILLLEKETISHISFGINFVSLFFYKGFIQFTSCFSIKINGKLTTYNEVYPVKDDFGLLAILEKKISSVTTNEERDILIIEFENFFELTLIGTEFYESFNIRINEDEILV